jgi:eukaryotic-like serine/threonine-protein kinase
VHPKFSGRFRDPEEFARGGMGAIEEAHDELIGRQVAIKTLHPVLREDERAVLRFVEEARITGQLEHPNVVPIYDVGENAAEPFIVMRLIQGKSLAQVLGQSAKPATSAELADLLQRFVQILLRVCDALSFAHGRGVFHCDVKPDNIMVGDYGQVYLMDWGVALTDQPREGFGGTVAYMAPEQLLGDTDNIDARTDVFGLGGVLYEILTGTAPNHGNAVFDAARGRGRLTFSARDLWTRLPPELCRIAAKALSPERAQRYPSVAALRADLEQFMKGGGWFDTLTAKAGDTIVTEGEAGDEAYIIQTGSCEVWKNIQGRPTLIRSLGPGDVFGEAAVFAHSPRTASIVATADLTLKVVTGESLNHELDQNPNLAAFVRSLANLFCETDAALSARGREPQEPVA